MSRLALRLVWLLSLVIASTACNLGAVVTEVPTPTSTPQPQQSQQMPIVYYYFASIPSNTFPAGSVVIVPDVLILSPTVSNTSRSSDVAMNIQAALQNMISDPRNIWTSTGLTITSVTFNAGEATVVLNGNVSGVGGAVLSAASMQFLMTVFADPSVQKANVTLNGENISNLGISHSSQAKPANYMHTRAEIEAFMRDNAHNP